MGKMKIKVLSVLFVSLFHLGLVSCESRPIRIPSKATFPIEGDVFTVLCKTAGDIKDVKFIDNHNKDVKNSTDGKQRTITSRMEGSVKVKAITWNPLNISDEALLSGLACQSTSMGATGFSYNIKLIPKENKPEVSIKEANFTVVKDSVLTLTCSANMVWGPIYDSFNLQWFFDGKEIVDETINKLVDEKDNKTYQLVIPKVAITNEGQYRCQANIRLAISKSMTEDAFSRTVDVNVDWPPKTKYPKEELVLMNEEKSVMVCVMPGYPKPSLRWKKDDSVISANTDPRYEFEYSDEQKSDNATFKINKVTYKDRGVYTCEATFEFRSGKRLTAERKFVLRVRDPLGPLWPAIGILVEAIVLFIIIALYSCLKKPKHFQERADTTDGPTDDRQGEKSPLVKDGPHVSYNSSEDGVRSRTSTKPENA